MLYNRDILVFADDWGRHPSTPQHLARVFMRDNRILWVNSLGFRAPKISVYDLKRIGGKLSRMMASHPAGERPSAVLELHPIVAPFYDSRSVRNLNDRLLRNQVRRAMERSGMHRPILLAAHPLVARIVGTLGESSSHYLCLDDYPSLPGAYANAALLEQEMLGRVDTVFAVSEQLRTSRTPGSGKSYFLPQGVDLDHFTAGSQEAARELRALRRPIVGFHGMISEWVDVELISRAARVHSNMTFVLIGRSMVDLSMLNGRPNIVRLDHVSYDELPGYVGSFDVGLIPFKINELTVASNPLKLVEYLALGLPVVSTDLPELRRFSQCVAVAPDADAFISMIPLALETNTVQHRLARRQVAERYSWKAVAEDMSGVIEMAESDGKEIVRAAPKGGTR